MEIVSLLVRNKRLVDAKILLEEALKTHTLAGRLWGELI
jgi:hypothetical protein